MRQAKLLSGLIRTRNITRYEASRGGSYSFRGWRLCITRQKERFVRYFSDREHGGDGNLAYAEALKMRDAILAELAQGIDSPAAIFERFRKVYL